MNSSLPSLPAVQLTVVNTAMPSAEGVTPIKSIQLVVSFCGEAQGSFHFSFHAYRTSKKTGYHQKRQKRPRRAFTSGSGEVFEGFLSEQVFFAKTPHLFSGGILFGGVLCADLGDVLSASGRKLLHIRKKRGKEEGEKRGKKKEGPVAEPQFAPSATTLNLPLSRTAHSSSREIHRPFWGLEATFLGQKDLP